MWIKIADGILWIIMALQWLTLLELKQDYFRTEAADAMTPFGLTSWHHWIDDTFKVGSCLPEQNRKYLNKLFNWDRWYKMKMNIHVYTYL